jgi:multidrug efflux pump subunit AcrA (membrane-fusion protein)
VAASFSTPSLYMIAQDLSKMKVQVNIGESDIDDVKVGQRALFTVDSLPDKQFRANVSLVRQEPVTTSNVVNYVVEMIVPNEPLSNADEDGKATAAPEARKGGGRQEGKRDGAKDRGAKDGAKDGGNGREGAPDPEKVWERVKDRLPAGTTKQDFLKRFQERAATRGKAAPTVVMQTSKLDPQVLARIPGGASEMPGPKFTGNLALRSGMTANVTISTNQVQDVLRVPNSALRFNPSAFIKDEKKADGPRLGQPMMFGGGRPSGGAQAGTGTKGGMVARREDRIWVLENGRPKAIVVKAGISDGQFTEVSGEGLTEGMQILVGVDTSKQAGGAPAPIGGTQGGRR